MAELSILLEPARFHCADCGEVATSRDAAWVEQARSTHRCPSEEQLRVAGLLENAQRGRYDG